MFPLHWYSDKYFLKCKARTVYFYGGCSLLLIVKITKFGVALMWMQGFRKLYTVFPNQNQSLREFLGGPAVKTPCFHCQGHGFDPLSGD